MAAQLENKQKKQEEEKKTQPSQTQTPVDLSKPRYDLSDFMGRVKQYFAVSNPINMFLTEEQLENAKKTVEQNTSASKEEKQKGKTVKEKSAEELWEAKYQYQDAFTQPKGERRIFFNRMSAHLPFKIILMSGMVTFNRTKSAIAFWQFFNQCFTSSVRASNSPNCVLNRQWWISHIAACATAIYTSIFLHNKYLRSPNRRLLMSLLPFQAVCSAIIVQIPLERLRELEDGIPVYNESSDALVGNSTAAARNAAFISGLYRCTQHVPGLVIAPMLTHYAIRKELFCYKPHMAVPFQIALVAASTFISSAFIYSLFKLPALSTMTQSCESKTENSETGGSETIYYENIL